MSEAPSAMRPCHLCGIPLPPDARFCDRCGRPTAPIDQTVASPPSVAPTPATVPAGRQHQERPDWRTTVGKWAPTIGGWVFFTLVFLGIAAVFTHLREDKDTDAARPNTAIQTQADSGRTGPVDTPTPTPKPPATVAMEEGSNDEKAAIAAVLDRPVAEGRSPRREWIADQMALVNNFDFCRIAARGVTADHPRTLPQSWEVRWHFTANDVPYDAAWIYDPATGEVRT